MSNPQCSAIANALSAKGLNNTQLAAKAGLSEQRVTAILTGQTKPTSPEFSSIASALGLSNAPGHAAQVTA